MRMGRDKAQIAVSWEGETVPLWVRQLRLLQSLGAEELLFSGGAQTDEVPGAKIVTDEWPDAGPLSGIASCLRVTTHNLVLFLAVDVARIDAPILQKLLEKCHASCGIVPRISDVYEPLVAVYPRAALRIAIEQVSRRHLRLRDFVDRLLSEHLIREYPVLDAEIPLFANWNTPEDVV
jgi:molybdopterin-guanine dinucleotide biosynthesis protein A